jgi:hypothetical protein
MGARVVGRLGQVFEGLSSVAPAQSPPAVFLNDCDRAHPIVVEEIPNGALFPSGTTAARAHQVILHAGNQVIGIRRSTGIEGGGIASGAPLPTVEHSLELFAPSPLTAINDVFELDGDSIIVASSRPCISTDTTECDPAAPELVVQVQNGRGFDGAPIIVGERRLADPEFWDFVATDNSGAFPTWGFVNVSTADQLWNAVCASPATINGRPFLNRDQTQLDRTLDGGRPEAPVPCTSFAAHWGMVIVTTSPIRCGDVLGDQSDVGSCLDMSQYAPLVLPAGVTLRGSSDAPLVMPGVTLRGVTGGRRGTSLGPQLYAAYSFERHSGYLGQDAACISCMIQIHGDYSRVTGLRLRGQSRSQHAKEVDTEAITIGAPAWNLSPRSTPNIGSMTGFHVSVDHNDISDWEDAAVAVAGTETTVPDTSCGGALNNQRTQDNVHVLRNFLHNNERWSGGYGVNTAAGGRAFIEGNVFWMNRHAVASDGFPHNEYRAWYNLILRKAPSYSSSDTGKAFLEGPQQVFDVHGTGDSGYGGLAGYMVDIAGNTFLGHISGSLGAYPLNNFELRGTPCATPSYFRDNITRQNQSDSIHFHNIGYDFVNLEVQGPDVPSTPLTVLPDPVPCRFCPIVNDIKTLWSPTIVSANNQYFDSAGFYDATDTEANRRPLGVGDFDGDGTQDLFLATGTAWYFAPGGTAEWRFLSAKTDKIETLLLGDFDGDGRTDVVTKRGASLWVSWGGVSDWELLNNDPRLAWVQIGDLAVGKFLAHPTGDLRDDVFLADGKSWWLSYGGSGLFRFANTSVFRVNDVRFGDFDGDGKTDVFGIVSFNQNDLRWAFSKSAQGPWTSLRAALTNTLDQLILGDFDGDGRADIATADSSWRDWMISFGGASDWTHYPARNDALPGACVSTYIPSAPAVGFFAGNKGADILLWSFFPQDVGSPVTIGDALCMIPGGNGIRGQVDWTAGLRLYSRQDMR